MVLDTDSRDYEIQDQNSPQNINFSWQCSSLTSNDHICYDYNNKQLQLQQGVSSLTFPAKTFQPYTIIQLTVIGQKDSRMSSFTAICIFTELNIPALKVLFTSTRLSQKINLNDDLNFQIAYGENVSSDYLSYAGAILYDNDPVAAIKFDYFQVKLRIWNYFQDVNPLKPTVQIRFSVYNPLYVMPSISTITIKVNIPPQSCVLSINPLQGTALQTVFQISFLSCTDDDLPLTYQFFYYNSVDDAKQELISPWNIVRRQIQDQTINNSIQTVLPQGNLVIMGQVMDSQLGVYNSSSIITIEAQSKSENDYYSFINQLTLQTLSNSNMQVTSQLVTLSIISEDISKNKLLSQQLQQLNDSVSLLIQNIQKLQLQIPDFSLLSTFANKVTAQLSQLLYSSPQQIKVTIQKNEIFKQIQLIVDNTNQTMQNNNLSHLQQNNDVQIQNMVDSFKILNSSVTLNTNNSFEDIQNYDRISNQIGNMLNNISLPNQGQTILNGNLSTLLSDKVTQKNLFKYVLNLNDSDSTNETSIFSISRNTYKQNIYDKTQDFQAYAQQFKNISQNFTYSQNELISPQIYNSTSQATLNQSTIIYQFNNANYSQQHKMTCLQKKDISWDQKNCNINNINQNDFICLCKSQQPTTIIEDVEDMFLKNKNLQTAFGEQGLLNILNFENFYLYLVFWLLAGFTFAQLCLFVVGKLLDKYTIKTRYQNVHNEVIENKQPNDIQEQGLIEKNQQENNQNLCENDKVINDDDIFHSPQAQQLKSNEKMQLQNKQTSQKIEFQMVAMPSRRKRQKFLNLQRQKSQTDFQENKQLNIEVNEEKKGANQLQIIRQVSITKSLDRIKTQQSSQTQMVDVQDQEECQKMKVYLQLSKIKKVAIFHQFFGIFYIFDDTLSRPLRLTLLYLKIIHTLVISILFYGYNTLVQQVIIALINSTLMKIVFFGIIFTFKKGSIGKWISLFLQIGISLVYYYVILAVSSGKTPGESNKFISLFIFKNSLLSFHQDIIIKIWNQNIDILDVRDLIQSLEQCVNMKNLSIFLDDNFQSVASDIGSGLTKCTNLTSLTLEIYNTDDQGASNLSSCLAECHNLQKLTLNLNNNKIGENGTSDLGYNLAKCTNLQVLALDLSENLINAQGASKLVIGLAQCAKLSTLTINLNKNSICENGALDLCQGLSKNNTISNLTLCLNKNQIGDAGASGIGSCIAKFSNLSILELNLDKNLIGVSSASNLIQGIAKCSNLVNLALSLRGNQMKGSNSSVIGFYLSQCTNLSNFKLDIGCNQIDDKGLSALSSDLTKCSNLQIIELYLDCNEIGDIGVQDLSFGLSKCCNIKSLILNLSRCKISQIGASVLGNCLKKLINISALTIDLSFNQIEEKEGSSFAFSSVMWVNLSSLNLNFYDNKISDCGASSFSSCLAQCINLQNLRLDLSNCQIGEQGSSDLGYGLAKCSNMSILKLYINQNNIGKRGSSDLGYGLAKCIYLYDLELDLQGNQIGSEGILDLVSGLSKCAKLFTLTIYLEDNLLSGRKSCQKLLSQVKKIKRLVKSKIIIGEQEGGTEDSDIEDSENEDQDQNYLSDQNEQFIEDSD